MALGDGIGRNKDVANWVYRRQRDYKLGAMAFVNCFFNKYQIKIPNSKPDDLLKEFLSDNNIQ